MLHDVVRALLLVRCPERPPLARSGLQVQLSVLRETTEPRDLPPDALILEEPAADVWLDETFEFQGLAEDDQTPHALRSHLCSFRLPSGVGCHAFKGGGTQLSRYLWRGGTEEARRRGAGPRTVAEDDARSLRLVVDLLEAVNHLHCRGSAHLDLSGETLRVRSTSDQRDRLDLIGLGAAVRLQPVPGRTAYQLGTQVAFRAPESLSGPFFESNLRALLLMDAWSVGVLIAMVVSSSGASPFAVEADWARGEFSVEAATSRAVGDAFRDFAPWLQRLDADGGGLLFRHGWLVRLVLGLLTVDPSRRLTVHEACLLAQRATASLASAASFGRPPQPAAAEADPLAFGVAAAPAGGASAGGAGGGAAAAGSELRRYRGRGGGRRGGGGGEGRESEPYRSLEAIVNIAERGRAVATFERRQWEGLRNYGEVIGFRNRADGDRWDVFVPGLEYELPLDTPFPLQRVLGVVLIKGGNHKLAIAMPPPHAPPSRDAVEAGVQDFLRIYAREHPGQQSSRMRYLELDQAVAAAGTAERAAPKPPPSDKPPTR